ncbi:prolipoprotein diacylglyceryl transferase [Peptoniphilus sp. AGMB00490]|uniref:Phosphatidylglycerol--prolipoprotein diacylglyceryl transferase n=1 Tax=Peptoniphilus faecalis TaxID=2731255 RepID=A0A848RFR6_9FIRM|nr:prolipoprotein diacylglyceryl transferase [Peptoniphilus faecalis]NMW84299.1 prolipoprotein diacylglyceryl transferase [Peptoniphilus faecalis]
MKINPVAFTIFGLEVKWYGILIAIGVFLAIFITEKMAEKKDYKFGLYKDISTDVSIFAVLIGVLGARLYYVIFEWEYYSKHLDEIFAIRNGGLAIYGGIIAGGLAIYFFCKHKKVKTLTLLDCVAPGLALAQSIGRWGNYINGEAHGGVTDVPWAILVDGQWVHPTFFYESIVNFSIFLFLYFYLSKRQKFEGELISFYMIVYGIARFFIEGMRTDSLYIGIFRVSQLVSIAIIIFGISIRIIAKSRQKNVN